ncbi:MAG: hypothetical protein ACOXZW_01690 [Bacilli bacterium]|jgi:hypothetical protein|nr:hypothetical protein [Bacilli bacterium]
MLIIKYSDIINNNFSLSPNNYNKVPIETTNVVPLSLLVEKIIKGEEIGSRNYTQESVYKFIRTSGIVNDKYLLDENENSILNINPNSFVSKNLSQGDILICKDSNVGDVAMLRKDYDTYMFSSGINKLILKRHKNYVFSVMKHKNFKKQLITLISKGSTLKHAKNTYLKCLIPFPNDDKVIEYVSNLTLSIVNKEKIILEKFNEINKFIENTIDSNQKANIFVFKFPRLSQILGRSRLDTGIYNEEYKKIEHKILNFSNGYYYISKNKIHGGNTPKQRIIGGNKEYDFYWITPTSINDFGIFNLGDSIYCKKQNINKNCMLIINRTSKGGKGEYVGIAHYYDYRHFGLAQHNQGIYRIDGYPDEELIFMTCLLNSKYYRKLCANLSMGSKMKEIKLNNILEIPFPNFSKNNRKTICQNYYNKETKLNDISPTQFLSIDNEWNKKAGIINIYESLHETKKILNKVIDDIYNNVPINITYKIF